MRHVSSQKEEEEEKEGGGAWKMGGKTSDTNE